MNVFFHRASNTSPAAISASYEAALRDHKYTTYDKDSLTLITAGVTKPLRAG